MPRKTRPKKEVKQRKKKVENLDSLKMKDSEIEQLLKEIDNYIKSIHEGRDEFECHPKPSNKRKKK